jgi:hypothetical protein
MADLNDLTQNVNLWNDDKSKSVTVTTDGAKERLDVNASIEGSVTISSTIPRWNYSATSVGLTNGVDFDVLTIGPGITGFIDFIQIICKNSSYDSVIEIDGVEELRISQADLGTIGLLSSNSTGIPIYAASASKIFSLHPNQPFHFTDELHIKVQATSAGNNINGFMVTWREQV